MGAGFLCDDGVVICADTQVTWEQSHKYYETKLYPLATDDYTLVFTYAGNPEMMRMFFAKFQGSTRHLKPPLSTEMVRNLIESVLSNMDILDSPHQVLRMLCGVAIRPSGEIALVRTENKIVNPVRGFDYIGTGDSSLLRYLSKLLTETRGYTMEQAKYLCTYFVLQAKRYIDGCGGETEMRTISKSGSSIFSSNLYSQEQMLLRLEFTLGRVGTYFFDRRFTVEEFNEYVDRFARMLKEYRPELR